EPEPVLASHEPAHSIVHALVQTQATTLSYKAAPAGCSVSHACAQEDVEQPLKHCNSAEHSSSSAHTPSCDEHSPAPDVAACTHWSHVCTCDPARPVMYGSMKLA